MQSTRPIRSQIEEESIRFFEPGMQSSHAGGCACKRHSRTPLAATRSRSGTGPGSNWPPAVANALGLTIVAGGVETRAQADWLCEQGVSLVQGFPFGRPGPPEQLSLGPGRIRNNDRARSDHPFIGGGICPPAPNVTQSASFARRGPALGPLASTPPGPTSTDIALKGPKPTFASAQPTAVAAVNATITTRANF